MTRAIPAVLAVVLLTAACATHQAPERSAVAAGIAERTGVTNGGLPVPGKQWALPPGTSLDDGLSEDEAAAMALWNNPRFQATLATLGIARAELLDAGLLKNPILSLLFPWGPKQLEFTASWSIDAIWQRPKRVAEAKVNAETVASQLVSSGVNFVADVRLAFLDAVIADRRLALAVEQADIAARASELAQGRFRAGDISEFEWSLSRADALRLEAVRLNHVAARDRAYIRLRTLIGLGQGIAAPRLVAPPPSTAVCGTADDLIRTALAARPDVRAAELQIEAAGARAGLERSRIMAFTALLDANAKGTEGFEMGPGLSVEIPLLSQNQGRRARAAAEIEQASFNYLAVRATVAADVASAVAGLTEAGAIVRLLGSGAEPTLATAKQQAERLHQAGEISMLDVFTIRQRLLETEVARVEAELGVNRARVRLEQAIGKTCEVK